MLTIAPTLMGNPEPLLLDELAPLVVAYLVGMALAPFFVGQRELQLRMRAICFAFLTPFYFLKAGSLIDALALAEGAVLIGLFLAMKMATKFVGILPLTRYFKFLTRHV